MSAKYRSIFLRRTSTEYWSYVDGISVNCQWYIGQLLVAYQSCVNLAGESKREQVSDRPAQTARVVLAVSLVSFDVQNGIVFLSVDQ